MSTSTGNDARVESEIESRVLREGYGPGAWHGPDLKAALAEVTPAMALWRPGVGRTTSQRSRCTTRTTCEPSGRRYRGDRRSRS
jgi:hypothetical protein